MANPLLGAKKKLSMMAQYLAKDAPGGSEFPKAYERYLALSQVTHAQFMDALEHALEPTGENLGLTGPEMIELMKRMKNPRNIRQLVFKKLSPNDQQAHPELGEDLDEVVAGPAPGTSFTSTANVAKYPVPLGTLRPGWWKRKKKKK